MEKMTIRKLQEKVALQRDQQAYKTLFLYFYKVLTPFALSVLKSMPVAEETVSDVMLNIWQLENRLLAVEDLRIYLFRAVKNRAINRLTREKHTEPFNDSESNSAFWDEESTPYEQMQKKELRHCLANAIAALPPRCAAVYHLVKEEGLSYRAAAGILSISENTVDRQLNNALHKLIAALRTHLGEGGPAKKIVRQGMGKPIRVGVLQG